MMEIDVGKCFHFIQTKASELGKAEGEVIRLEAKVKSIKAALMDASDSSSAAMKEVDAFKHPVFTETVLELSQATATKVELGILIKAAFQKVETARAQMYLSRQELKNIG